MCELMGCRMRAGLVCMNLWAVGESWAGVCELMGCRRELGWCA